MATLSTYVSDRCLSWVLAPSWARVACLSHLRNPILTYSSYSHLKTNPPSTSTPVTFSPSTLQPEILTFIGSRFLLPAYPSTHCFMLLVLLHVSKACGIADWPLPPSWKTLFYFHSYFSFADSRSSALLFSARIPQGSLLTLYFLFGQFLLGRQLQILSMCQWFSVFYSQSRPVL